ncbi:hypothetical protein [Paenibacillus sp.]|uniref:hypothetical protein n=1 Tax=Paenibacillus sp. TaxID=58172 RepID=UPI002D718CB8|nr:hypothetical protein [Paenibacillus sp.]HZG58541.1 hypothetical protein [Paenibacillus sp.]
MYLRVYVRLREGDACVVTRENHPLQGEVVEFRRLEYCMQQPVYVFRAADGCRVALPSEFDFVTLPYKESLRFLIDLALDTGDEAWARELTDRLLYLSQA